jgi:hypothetical protein
MRRGFSPAKKKRATPNTLEESDAKNAHTPATPARASKRQVTPRHHDAMIHRAISFQTDKNTLEEQLEDAMEIISLRDKEIVRITNQLEEIKVSLDDYKSLLEEEKQSTKEQAAELENLKVELEKDRFLCYEDLRPGGLLGKNVKDFTFFDDFASNEAFLKVVNFADNSEGGFPEGDGLCEGMLAYSKLTLEERATQAANPDAVVVKPTTPPDKRRQRKCHYKTDWLIFNLYIHSGWTQNQIAPLFGISYTTVYNVVYAWANLLYDVLSAWFPLPTRAQMLQAYPRQLYRKFGHCRIHTLFDATEIFTDKATRLKVYSVLYSHYKNHATLKFLIGCDGIGTTWDEGISDGFGGSISDPQATRITKLLESIPFGAQGEVDKGFLSENDAIQLGVGLVRPAKCLDNQVQQSATDTARTQKVGNTRIAVEQLNGGSKASCNFFNSNIKILQLGLAPIIVKVVFLMQNFRPGYVQGRRVRKDDQEGRPCRGEVRWYDATEDGLFDARGDPKLWATLSELKRWNELRVEQPNVTDETISDLVLAEDIPKKLLEQLEELT